MRQDYGNSGQRAGYLKKGLNDKAFVEYKSVDDLRRLMTPNGKIYSRKRLGVTAREQRMIARALDDWEWGVSLHADDMLVFKKLVYEMRFDQATSLFAQFGPFYLGIRTPADALTHLLAGTGA